MSLSDANAIAADAFRHEELERDLPAPARVRIVFNGSGNQMTQPTQAIYQGVYINLDRCPERRELFERQLAELGIENRYARFSAVDGTTLKPSGSPLRPGEIGAFLSHYKALEQARNWGKCVHILEDDALLSKHVVPVIEGAIAEKVFERFDLLFTDMAVYCHVGFMKTLKWKFDELDVGSGRALQFRDFKTFDLAQVFHAAFQSYVVGAKSIDRVLTLYGQELSRGITTPVDIFIQQQVLGGNLRATCLFPFITSFRLDDVLNSTIASPGERTRQPSVMVAAVLRYLFFLGCDLQYAKQKLDTATHVNRRKTDMRQDLMVQATEFVMSDDFVEGVPP